MTAAAAPSKQLGIASVIAFEQCPHCKEKRWIGESPTGRVGHAFIHTSTIPAHVVQCPLDGGPPERKEGT